MIRQIEDMIKTTSVVGYRGTSNALINFDLSAKLGAINSSVLVIAGEHDQAATVAMSQKMVSLLTKAQLVIVKNAAHICSAEQRDFFNKEVINFLFKTEWQVRTQRNNNQTINLGLELFEINQN